MLKEKNKKGYGLGKEADVNSNLYFYFSKFWKIIQPVYLFVHIQDVKSDVSSTVVKCGKMEMYSAE